MILHQELLDGSEHKPLNIPREFEKVNNWLLDGVARNPEALSREKV